MPSEILSTSESNGKRKIKNKAPKRLRRKNKPVENDTEKNETEHISATGNMMVKDMRHVRFLSELFRQRIIDNRETNTGCSYSIEHFIDNDG